MKNNLTIWNEQMAAKRIKRKVRTGNKFLFESQLRGNIQKTSYCQQSSRVLITLSRITV